MKRGSFVKNFVLIFMVVFICIGFSPLTVAQASEVKENTKTMDLTPKSPEDVKKDVDAMSADLSSKFSNVAVPILLISLGFAALLLLIGIFSKRALVAGGVATVVAVGVFFFLSDSLSFTKMVQSALEWIRSYI